MSQKFWLIQYESGAYRFARLGVDAALVDTPAGDPLAPLPLVAALREAGYGGQAALLAIPSRWCLAATAELGSRRLTRQPSAVAYALEEHLPVSAEELVCDYLVGRDTTVFGVAVETARLLPVVEALAQHGVTLESITPTALLWLEELVAGRAVPRDGLVLVCGGDDDDLFVLRGGRPSQWRCLPRAGDALTHEVAAWLLTQAEESVCPVAIVNPTDEALRVLYGFGPRVAVTIQERNDQQVLLPGAAHVLSDGCRPWIELRRGPLGHYDRYGLVRGAIRGLLGAILLALLVLSAAAGIRAARYAALRGNLEREKRALFQELFPATRVPAGIRARLESECRMLSGLSAAAQEQSAGMLRSITASLVAALAALPTDVRFRLLEMRFDEEQAYLAGEVRRHGDVDRLASALRAHGFEVASPRTEQLAEEGVGFALSLVATPIPARDVQESPDAP